MRFPILLFCLLAALVCRCQEFSYTHYDTKDGLAGSVVYCAAEDREGFLWFGTETGLSRFDGTHFKNFTTVDGLPDNEVLKIFVDSKNRVWMIPFKNAVCYYWKGKIYNADNDPVLRRLSVSSDLYSIQEDKYGNIDILEKNGIQIISPLGRVTKIDTIGGQPVDAYVAGGLNAGGEFTFFTERVYRQNIYVLPGTGMPVSIKESEDLAQPSPNTVFLSPGLNVFRKGNRLVISPANGASFELPVPTGIINVSRPEDSLLCVDTHSGVLMYNIRTRQLQAHFLEHEIVNDVKRDSEGNLWFMCAGSGIFRIGSLAFKNLRFPGEGTALSVSTIRKIDNNLLIATEKGPLWRADPLLKNVRRQPLHGYKWPGVRIVTMQKTDRNSILMGTDNGLVNLVNFSVRSSIVGTSIKSITNASKDTWLICSSGGAYLLHLSVFTFGNTNAVWKNRITCSYIKDTVFYFGTLNGLYTFVPGHDLRFLGAIAPVFKRRIADIGETPDGVLWVATYGQGIAGYKNDRLLYTFTEKDGLTSNICRNLCIAGNELWVGTDKGLNRIRWQKGKADITRFSMTDGLSSDMINAVYADSASVYVGTSRGLTYFNPNSMAARSACKLRITAIQTPAHTWAYDTSGMVLPHRENSIRIEFVGISFRSAGDITYKYRLLGLSDTWHTTRETFLSYPTLPSGRYELELMAINKFGMLGEPLRVRFSVEKLLWEENWFVVLTAAMATAIIWFLVSIRIRRLKKQNREKLLTGARIAELEQRALKAQMNPHFIFNSLNSIQQYVIEKDFKGVNKFITGFSRLIRLTLEMSSKTSVPLEEEVKYLTTYLELEKNRFEDKFTYQVDISPGIDPIGYYIPPMILQPYVENSIRHGVRNRDDNDGKIRINFTRQDQYLVCVIEDNGVGRKEAQKFKSQIPIEYQSRGMALTASRVEMINKMNATPILIHIEDGQINDAGPSGTRVIIRFPVHEIIKPTSFLYDQSAHYR